MKYVLVPMGSAGDVHPFVWIGKLLQSRGHEVVMLAQEVIREIPERAGIPIVPIGDRATQEAVLTDPRLWHPMKALDLLIEHIPAWAAQTIAAIDKERARGDIALLGGGLAFGARIAAERWNLPLITLHLQPSVFVGIDQPTVPMAGLEWLARAPRWVRRAFWSVAHFQIDRKLKRPVNQLRRDAGIHTADVSGVMRHYWHSPDGVLCLFPEWYAPKAADWPAQTVLTRFPLYDEAAERSIDPALESFLTHADKPVIITPGSANSQAATFLHESVEACRLLNRRAIILTRYPEQLPPNLPDTIVSFEYAPFSRVFPRAAAVIHHGGIGTMAQCFSAGVPQLLMPMAHDQPDNASRIRRLGVGEYLYPKKFQAPAIAKKLSSLLASESVTKACGNVRERMRTQMSPDHVARIVEGMTKPRS